MNEIIYIIIWIFGLIVLGIINFPLTYIIFNKLKDRGYAFSRTLALLLISLSVWLFGFFKIITIDYLLWIFFIILVILNIFLFFRKKIEIKHFFKSNIKYVFFIEIIFMISFCCLIFIVSLSHFNDYPIYENMVDTMIFNSLGRSNFIPPIDAWFSGHILNYYYFGHLIGVMIMKIFFTPIEYGYNLFFVMVMALSFISIFSIIYNLTKKYWVSFLSILLFFSGNLYIYLQIINKQLSTFNFASASTYIKGVFIHFPVLSFRVGEAHSHYNVMILTLLFFALLLNYFFSAKRNNFSLLIMGLVLGAITISHGWDLPVYTFLFLIVFIGKQVINTFSLKNLLDLIVPFITFSILFIPHYIFSYSNVNIRGLGLVTSNTGIFEYFLN